MARPLLFIPPVIFVALAALFYVGMQRENPGDLPSTFIGRPAPPIEAVALAGLPSFAGEDLLGDGEVKIVNFWASWCPPCRAEHPALVDLAEEGVPIYGVNNKDRGGDALGFLEELGNPYRAVTVDANGRQSIEWGVVALPETFVLDGEGRVVLKFPGPIHGVMDNVIRPALEEAEAAAGGS